VKKRTTKGLDFVIDKLTNSIENRITGDSFTTNIIHLSKADLKAVTKKNGWVFDWRFEVTQPEREVYKLTISENANVIQGLISLKLSLTMYTCIWLKVLRSIKEVKKFIPEFLGT